MNEWWFYPGFRGSSYRVSSRKISGKHFFGSSTVFGENPTNIEPRIEPVF